MTEHQEPLSQFSLHHGKVAKLFLSTNALTRKKETVAWTKPSRLHPEHGHSAKNVTTDGEPGHVGFQCLTITARYPGSVCMRGPETKEAVPSGAGQRPAEKSTTPVPRRLPDSDATTVCDVSAFTKSPTISEIMLENWRRAAKRSIDFWLWLLTKIANILIAKSYPN